MRGKAKPPPDGGGDQHGRAGDRAAATRMRPAKANKPDAMQPPLAPVEKTAWTGAAAVRALFAKAEEAKATHQAYPDEVTYAEEYACARAPSMVMPPGRQREPTALERRTLWLWRNGTLHLEQPPLFAKVVHTVKQRMRDLEIQRDHKFFRVYLKLHPSFRLRTNGAKYHFFMTMLGMNDNNEVTDGTALSLLSKAYTIRCSPTSQCVVFLCVRPEDRDALAGKTSRLPGGAVTLQATESFASEDPDMGYDDVAMMMLYQNRLIGSPTHMPLEIARIAEAICGGIDIVHIEVEEPTGTTMLGDTVWVVMLATQHGPDGLQNVRELSVPLGTRRFRLACISLGYRCTRRARRAWTIDTPNPNARMMKWIEDSDNGARG